MMTLEELKSLPWSVRVETRIDDGTYFVARIDELPGLVATAARQDDLSKALDEALESHLKSYLEDGETPPRPDSGVQTLSMDFKRGDEQSEGFDYRPAEVDYQTA